MSWLALCLFFITGTVSAVESDAAYPTQTITMQSVVQQMIAAYEQVTTIEAEANIKLVAPACPSSQRDVVIASLSGKMDWLPFSFEVQAESSWLSDTWQMLLKDGTDFIVLKSGVVVQQLLLKDGELQEQIERAWQLARPQLTQEVMLAYWQDVWTVDVTQDEYLLRVKPYLDGATVYAHHQADFRQFINEVKATQLLDTQWQRATELIFTPEFLDYFFKQQPRIWISVDKATHLIRRIDVDIAFPYAPLFKRLVAPFIAEEAELRLRLHIILTQHNHPVQIKWPN